LIFSNENLVLAYIGETFIFSIREMKQSFGSFHTNKDRPGSFLMSSAHPYALNMVIPREGFFILAQEAMLLENFGELCEKLRFSQSPSFNTYHDMQKRSFSSIGYIYENGNEFKEA
jgi:hypothetical protein